MMRATKLVDEIIAAHRELGLSAVVVDDALASATQAVNTLATARGAVVAAHHRLEEVRKRMGVRLKMTGWKPVPSAIMPAEAEAPTLREAG